MLELIKFNKIQAVDSLQNPICREKNPLLTTVEGPYLRIHYLGTNCSHRRHLIR